MGVLNRLLSRGETREATLSRPPRTVLAAAMPLSGPALSTAEIRQRSKTFGGQQWQRDAWYFYDAVGELRAPTVWIANAVSRAQLQAVEIDPETGLDTGPTEDTRVQQVAAMALGGPARRAQLMWLLAVCWQIPGEAYIIVRPRGEGMPDEWLVLSGTKMKPKGDGWEYVDPETGAMVRLTKRDLLVRVWSPHPDDQTKADSAVRPALPSLREVEKSSQSIAARLDSRLASNGLLFLPEEIDFPQGDFDTKAEAFADYLYEAMSASLKNPGQAASQVPIVATVPGEMIGQLQHLDLSTDMDASLVDLRRDALVRLASTLDMPKPVAEGTQGEANHWSAWQISEDTYQIFIEPLLDRIGDALTSHWFHPVLEAMGVQNPERYTLAWDTSEIVKRPDRTAELDTLYEQGLISNDFRRAEAGIPDEAIPSEDESRKRLLEKIVMGAPTLLADPLVARELLGIEIAPAAVSVDPAAATVEAGQEAPEAAVPTQENRALPDTQDDVPDGLVAAAEVLVLQALDRAGGRLLTNQNRGQFKSVPRHELHQHIRPEDPGSLVDVRFADGVAEAFGMRPAVLKAALQMYVRHLLSTGNGYDPAELRRYLR